MATPVYDLYLASRQAVSPWTDEPEHRDRITELDAKLVVAAANHRLCDHTDLAGSAARAVIAWLIAKFDSSLDEARSTAVESAIELLSVEGSRHDEQAESDVDQGIAIFDVAFLIEEDDQVATQTVKRWVDSKRITAKPIGKCPRDARKCLYRLSELLSDVRTILNPDRGEMNKYRQALTAKLRSPAID